ncbi:hypothetical protein BH09PLA1_BH09PLA1_34590 [soil metagenome]
MSDPPIPPLAPLHVLPVYDGPPSRAKPAVITLMGIAAIVIASLSMVASGVTGMIALGMMIQTQVSKTMTASASVRTLPTPRSNGSGAIEKMEAVTKEVQSRLPVIYPTGPRGIDESQRLIVREALDQSLKLSEAQALRLDQLLAKAGKDIFPFGVPTNSDGGKIVSESGTLGSGDAIANYYLIGSGKLEIYADRGVFASTEGEPIRVWEHEADDTASDALSARQIDDLLADAQAQVSGRLNAAQLATLKRELSDPAQRLITPGARRQRLNVSMLADNSVSIFAGGFIQIDRAGNITTTSATMAASAFRIRSTATAMTLLDAVLAGLLAIYLLVVGILVLRQNRRGRGLQIIFAVLKIPIAILAAIGWMWTISDANAGAISSAQLKAWLWTFIAIGLLYPIGLLIAMRTRSVREYYRDEIR